MHSALPKPRAVASKSKWDSDDDDVVAAPAIQTKPSTQLMARGPPPYGQRKGFIPRNPQDFGDGGAFPEIQIAQYPLDMGRKSSKAGAPGSGTLALQTDAEGNLRYDLVLRQGTRDDKIIHSRFQDLQAKDITEEEDRSRPSEEQVQETTEKTRLALEKLTDARIKATQPKSVAAPTSKAPTFVRYTPSSSSTGTGNTRIIRMIEAPVDPMEPPKFKHKKVPRGPPSPPVPVMQSPPRKVSAEEQKNWVIPPCISNWKNAKGYTIPLDKRLAADGRGIQDVQINDNFAKLSEALAIADRHAREEVRIRAEMQAKLAAKEKKEKEDKLRQLAQRAREERSGIAPSHTEPTAVGSSSTGGGIPLANYDSESEEDEEEEDEAKVKERDEIRRERQRMRERELRMSHMGADTKAKVLSKMADRDISEKIALGLAQPTLSKDSMFDSRLFNQSSGLSSGFGTEDSYNIFDKPLFTGSGAAAVYRPKKTGDEHADVIPGVRSDRIEKIVENASMSKGPHRGFKGAEGGAGGSARDGPVQFEREDDGGDAFGIEEFMSSAKRGRDDAGKGKEKESAVMTPMMTLPSSISTTNETARLGSTSSLHNEVPVTAVATSSVNASMDPLDSTGFDPIQYINIIFPNEQSLSKVEDVLEKLRLKVEQLNSDISELVRQQTDGGSASQKEMTECKTSIQELHSRIRQIKSKAFASEQMVEEITKEIKSLDQTKKNLNFSIATVQKLQLLASSLEYIRGLSQRRQYLETAQLLHVIIKLLSYFESFRNVAQIAVLYERVAQLQVDLKRQVFNDFDSAFVGGTLRSQIIQLKDSCTVIEELGPENKKQLVDWYCDIHLKDYRSIFKQNPDVAGLDTVNRRYAWLKRLLKTHDDEHSAAFPPQWRVADALCERFCLDTKKDLADVLTQTEHTLDVKIMLAALQQTIEFEGKVDGRFSRVVDEYEEENQEQQLSKFKGIISSAFEPFLRLYIESEDKTLSAMMDAYRVSSVTQEDDSVLQSSTDLFLFYRQTLVQCSKLSTKKPFLDLCRLFGKWLKVYADVLSSKLPKDDKKSYSDEEIRTACLLEEKLVEKIDEKFKSTVSFAQEMDGFINVIGTAIKCLVHILEASADSALTTMMKKHWGNVDSVGDQSEYVTQIGTALMGTITNVRKTLSGTKFFRTLCDKFADSFLTKFHTTIFKCRPISEVGAEQMLLDTHALKTALVQITQIGGDSSEAKQPPPATYMKILGKGVLKVEQLLKVVLRSHEPPSAIVETYILLFPDGDSQYFQKILELKGLKRSEQQQVLDAFQQRTGVSSTGPKPSINPMTSTFQSSFATSAKFKIGNLSFKRTQ
ncbi:Vacuolar protein sorting-associated protein 53 [Blyttiomyces sp. JEL0837]|nr:Vacuolar protein sorting-associated protein 53 [Blyttiomyces sp. JEL0837]